MSEPATVRVTGEDFARCYGLFSELSRAFAELGNVQFNVPTAPDGPEVDEFIKGVRVEIVSKLIRDLWQYATGGPWDETTEQECACENETLAELYRRMSAVLTQRAKDTDGHAGSPRPGDNN